MKVTKKTWYIAHNNADTVHYGLCEKGTNLDTGQPELEKFYNESEWLERLKDFNIIPENLQ